MEIGITNDEAASIGKFIEACNKINIRPLILNVECVNCKSKNRLKGTMGSAYCGDCGRYWIEYK
jgi:hypothetical protein